MVITDLFNNNSNLLDDFKESNAISNTDVIDFENFATGTACIESSVKHTALTLKLRSSHLGGEIIMEPITLILEKMLDIEIPEFQIPELENFNIDLGLSKISSPKLGDVPQCLSDTLTNKLSTIDLGLMKDILDPFNEAIGKANNFTSEANDYLNSSLNAFTGSLSILVNSANKVLSDAMRQVINPIDLILFEQIDILYKYLQDTDYIQDYKNWKDMTKCIQTNCKPIAYKILTDNFLWYDEDKHTEFIMPIDLNSGRITFIKFFRTLTKEQSKQCYKIEKRYYQYLRDKKAIAREASKKLRMQKIDEDKNPFSAIVSSMTSTRNNIVNTLF
jgi:hypothetical protein